MNDSTLQLLVMFICNAAETGFILLFHNAFLGVDKKHSIVKKYLLIWIVSILLFFLITFVGIPTALRYIFVFLAYFWYALFYQGSLYQKVLSTLIGYFVFMAMGSCLLWIESFASGDSVQSMYASLMLALVNESALLSVGVVLATVGHSIQERRKITEIQWGMTLFYPAVAVFVILSLWNFSLRHKISTILVIDALSLLVALVVHFLLIQALDQKNQAAAQESLVRQQLQIENEKAEALNQAYTAQRKLTHEFRHHLDALSGLISQGEIEAAQEYMRDLVPQTVEENYIVNTKNPLLDAIFSQKYACAVRRGNKIYFQLQDLKNPMIATPDLVVVVSNLLDNALEAVQDVPDGIVEVKIQQTEEEFLISVRNQVKENVAIVNNEPPRTTKVSGFNGMGLPNTIAVLKKYGAHHIITCHDGWFQFTALVEKDIS